MPDELNDQYVVPVINEEVHADAIPVQTGGVRVTKHVEGHDEIVEQELRRGRVEIKRVKTDRVVDGPQQVQRVGNTLVIPVVSEVLRIEKQWVVTEEIHITQV
jgi:stress response protein YsnF